MASLRVDGVFDQYGDSSGNCGRGQCDCMGISREKNASENGKVESQEMTPDMQQWHIP